MTRTENVTQLRFQIRGPAGGGTLAEARTRKAANEILAARADEAAELWEWDTKTGEYRQVTA